MIQTAVVCCESLKILHLRNNDPTTVSSSLLSYAVGMMMVGRAITKVVVFDYIMMFTMRLYLSFVIIFISLTEKHN